MTLPWFLQAGDWLTGQMGEHGLSGQALLEAKNELLALQQVNQQKDTQVTGLQVKKYSHQSKENNVRKRFEFSDGQ